MKLRIVFACLVTLLFFTGCATIGLDKMKKQYNAQQYEAVIKHKVDCKKSQEGCNQAHLLKAHACYVLAKKGQNGDRYECAIKHYQTGIAYTTKWKLKGLDLNRDKSHENLLDSLRERRLQMRGDEQVLAYNEKLRKSATAWAKFNPDHPALNFFLNDVRLVAIEPILNKQRDDATACAELKSIVDDASARSRQLPADSPYADLYKNLRMRTSLLLRGCP